MPDSVRGGIPLVELKPALPVKSGTTEPSSTEEMAPSLLAMLGPELGASRRPMCTEAAPVAASFPPSHGGPCCTAPCGTAPAVGTPRPPYAARPACSIRTSSVSFLTSPHSCAKTAAGSSLEQVEDAGTDGTTDCAPPLARDTSS